MAKIAFSKLGLSKDTTTIKLPNDVEVKQYLPIEEKLELISKIVSYSTDDNGFYNPVRIDIYFIVETILAYTNITITEKQHDEKIFSIYDAMISGGLKDMVFAALPEAELESVKTSVMETIKSVYAYKNSVLGIAQTLTHDYDNLKFDVEGLASALSDEKNLDLVKGLLNLTKPN